MKMDAILDPHPTLIRRLQSWFEIQGLPVALMKSRSEHWHSATFSGARHYICFAIIDNGTGAKCGLLHKLQMNIPEADLPIPHNIVADIILHPNIQQTGFDIEALTVEMR